MGFFDKMKAAVGIGGAKVEIKLAPGTVAPGSFARGQVTLKGGKMEQKCNGIEVLLKRYQHVQYTDSQGKSAERLDSDQLSKENLAEYEQTINPESQSSWEFAVQIPRDADPSSRTYYEVSASADIPGAVDPSASVKIPLGAAAPVTIASVPGLLETARTLEYKREKTAELEQVLKQVLSVDAKNTEALRRLAQALDYDDRHAEAEPQWKAYTDLVPADSEGWHNRAQCAGSREAVADAVEFSRKAAELAPTRSYLWREHAEALEKAAKDSEALGIWDRALKAEEPGQECYVGRAKLLKKLGRKDEAVSAYQLAADRHDQGYLEGILNDLDELGQTPMADQLLDKKITADGEKWNDLLMKAERKLKQGQPRDALTVLDRILVVEKTAEDWLKSRVWENKGKAFEKLGSAAEAKAAYQTSLKEWKDNYEAKEALKRL